MFGTIECWSANATEEALTAKLFDLVSQKNKLNQDSPQIPPWAWEEAQERIKKGETTYAVDKVEKPKLPRTGGALDMLPKPIQTTARTSWKKLLIERQNPKAD